MTNLNLELIKTKTIINMRFYDKFKPRINQSENLVIINIRFIDKFKP
jgi:hypothetical protein